MNGAQTEGPPKTFGLRLDDGKKSDCKTEVREHWILAFSSRDSSHERGSLTLFFRPTADSNVQRP